jgi:hypothetical protein
MSAMRVGTETPRDGMGITDVALTVVIGHCLADLAAGVARTAVYIYGILTTQTQCLLRGTN